MTDFLQHKKLFIWDFDGTFCDTERMHFLAYERVFKQYGHPLNEKEYYFNFSMNGKGAQFESDRHHLGLKGEDVKKQKKAFYWQFIQEMKPQPFPPIYSILINLRKKQVRSWIASNSPKEEIEKILSHAPVVIPLVDGIEGFVEGRKKKPSPDIFIDVMKKCGVQPAETLIIEDSVIGLKAAAAAGCEAIWIKTPVNDNFPMSEPYVSALTHQELEVMVSDLNA